MKLWAFCDRGSSNTLLQVEGSTVVDLGTFGEPSGYVAVIVRTGSNTGRVSLFGLSAGFTFTTNAAPDETFTLPGSMTWDADDVDLTFDAGTGGVVYAFVVEQVGAAGGGGGSGDGVVSEGNYTPSVNWDSTTMGSGNTTWHQIYQRGERYFLDAIIYFYCTGTPASTAQLIVNPFPSGWQADTNVHATIWMAPFAWGSVYDNSTGQVRGMFVGRPEGSPKTLYFSQQVSSTQTTAVTRSTPLAIAANDAFLIRVIGYPVEPT